ncbi:PspC domain-containing protein [Nocardia australiensis]|uniref:PspC domain-containing protein n=1 Tax=Nocardia australiensis TaxID=2887191 RepID=UPI0027E0C6B7|nr:PspC domain-containing protein [Nocardia australiensis]
MTKTSFGDQLQQMWRTRPVRLPRQGPIAGVAAGFGQRYSVDPVLVRVALVVSTIFGGAGIVLYLLGWLMFNEQGDEASAAESLLGKGQSSQSQTKTIVLIVALAIAVTSMGPIGVGLAGSGLISMALMLAGWWMLHMRNPQPPPGTSVFGGPATDGGGAATGYPGTMFPPGSPMRTTGEFYAPDAPPTNVYTPYTKLPDAYIPDASVDSVTSGRHEATTTPIPGSAPQPDADTALPHKTDAPIERATTPADDSTLSPHAGNTAVPDPVPTPTDTDTPLPGEGTAPSLDKNTAPSGTDLTNESDSSANTSDPVTPSLPRQTSTPTTPAANDRTPPSWDPLGVAPMAWDLPEPTPARTIVHPPQKRPRSRLTPVVIGLAILAAAGAGALAASGAEWMTPGRIAAVALTVIGLGLVLGAFLRRGYGLLVLTAPLAGFVVLASMVGPIEFDKATLGERTWTPPNVADLQSSYEVTMGTGTLDLRSLNLTENRAVDLSVRMGDAQVLLPEGMTVRTECKVNVGDATCPTGITGPNTPGAPVLDLKVKVRAGNAEVHRG